jgi:hypothetical protein
MSEEIKHLYYRQIECDKSDETKISSFVDCGYNIFMDVKEPNLSETLHSIFDYEAGDVYAWPCDNIEKEEIDRLYTLGQRSFVLVFGYKEVIIYDLRYITQSEYIEFNKKQNANRVNFANDIMDAVTKEVNDLDVIEYLENYVKKSIEEKLKKYESMPQF